MVSIVPITSYTLASVPVRESAAEGPLINLFIHRQEKVEKVEKEESLEVENQRRPHSQDLHVQDFR
jgi:hypothetical protein